MPHLGALCQHWLLGPPPTPPPPRADTENERNGRGGFKAGNGTQSLSHEARSDLHPELRLRQSRPHRSLMVTQKLHRYSGPDDDTEQVCEKRISSLGPWSPSHS